MRKQGTTIVKAIKSVLQVVSEDVLRNGPGMPNVLLESFTCLLLLVTSIIMCFHKSY